MFDDPTYSTNLAPSNFSIYKSKEFLGGNSYGIKNIKTAVYDRLKGIVADFFHDSMQKIVSRFGKLLIGE